MQPVQVEIVRPPFYKRILSNPFRYYAKMMGMTFCLVTMTNIASVIFYENRRRALVEHPDIFSVSLFSKSVYYGFLWPSFYITALTNPRNAFVMWGGVEKGLSSIDYDKIDTDDQDVNEAIAVFKEKFGKKP
jgi:hypothetical protein